MRASGLKVIWLACLLLLAMPRVLLAQGHGTEHLNPARPEAWAMNYYNPSCDLLEIHELLRSNTGVEIRCP
jgi:hypothetical protein